MAAPDILIQLRNEESLDGLGEFSGVFALSNVI